MQEYEFMCVRLLQRNTVAKHRNDSNPLNAPPIHSAPYRAGHARQEIEREKVVRTNEAGVAEPAGAVLAPPIVFVPEKDESLRFCVAIHRLNAVTVRDSYLLHCTDEQIDSFEKAKLFAALNVNSRN